MSEVSEWVIERQLPPSGWGKGLEGEMERDGNRRTRKR